MTCYLLHFEKPYHHAKHYLGWSPEPQGRVNAHVHGKGARLTEVVHDAGIRMFWVRTWEGGDRKLERKLKNLHGPRVCPICQGEAVQLPLLGWMPAVVPEPVSDNGDGHDDVLPPPAGPLLLDIDFEGEADDLEEDMLDREFWSRGQW